MFCLCRMSKPLPKEGTKEYYEMLADEPSDFIDNGPEESKTAAEAVVMLQLPRLSRRLQMRM